MTHVLTHLVELIEARRSTIGGTSYTRQLLDGGTKRCARKFGEEATELIVAALAEDGKAVAAESADVLFHMLVLLAERRVPFDDVLTELTKRLGRSGLDEKAERGQKG